VSVQTLCFCFCFGFGFGFGCFCFSAGSVLVRVGKKQKKGHRHPSSVLRERERDGSRLLCCSVLLCLDYRIAGAH
jgi:hypothetical protein